ncbi:lasso peptide biosynthesis PqqD family chaperone [Streptomyces iconiensis]|uniref:Lasso peptide biosynthesis PqqD family chaperone n=1 Tax=Streptomyces iconiensis TaxID=1384038 RepID=A0ABT7A0J7_9ACTN|nr:lasso peptide biosynthesis PqqD family chaperone [Streptomyces iconiensis]MDJ1134845.1 lasso peptide biosynthesis PqqD family chaperone [Streptomyces iconiensis]
MTAGEGRLGLHPHITLTETGEGTAVLLNQRSGKYWQLNATALVVVRALQNGADEETAADQLAQAYPAGADQARGDVAALIATLTEAGALTRH